MKIISKNEINTYLPEHLKTQYGLTNNSLLAMFLAQVTHESACLTDLEESFNYSSQRLLIIFPKYFDKKTAIKCGCTDAHPADKESIANIAYADRMGNGNQQSGDGYKYRGRGAIQITGKYNYQKCQKDTGIQCVDNPDLLLNIDNAILSALWFWKEKNLTKFGTDITAVTQRINGGQNGLAERQQLFNAYLNLLGR